MCSIAFFLTYVAFMPATTDLGVDVVALIDRLSLLRLDLVLLL